MGVDTVCESTAKPVLPAEKQRQVPLSLCHRDWLSSHTVIRMRVRTHTHTHTHILHTHTTHAHEQHTEKPGRCCQVEPATSYQPHVYADIVCVSGCR